jgi:hypothetical protein
MVVLLADAAVGACEGPPTVMVLQTHPVVLQSPRPRTEYEVVVVGFTRIDVPTPMKVPPEQEPEYHSQEAAAPSIPPFTVSVAESPAQIVDLSAAIPVGALDWDCTVTVIEAHAVELHGPSART